MPKTWWIAGEGPEKKTGKDSKVSKALSLLALFWTLQNNEIKTESTLELIPLAGVGSKQL